MASDNTQPAEVMAKLLDITPRRLQQLATDGVIPKAGRGRYPLVASVQGYIRYLRDRTIAKDPDLEEIDVRRERALLTRAQREKINIEMDILKAKLLPFEAVDQVWNDRVLVMRAKVLGLAKKLPSIAMQAKSLQEVEDYTYQEIAQALDELSTETEDYAASYAKIAVQSIESDQVAAEADHSAMG